MRIELAPLTDVGGDQVFGRGGRVLGVGHHAVVDAQRVSRTRILDVQEDVAVAPHVGNVELPAHDGDPLGRHERLRLEGLPVAARFAVARLGVVARVVGDDLRAVDAASFGLLRRCCGRRFGLLGPDGQCCRQEHSRAYRSFHCLLFLL